jgi:uncharacterized protein YlzI (FlbEa/FlbD family)
MFVKVTQQIIDYSKSVHLAPKNEIINWINIDNVDRLIDGTNGVSICFVSGTDIEVKESVDEILKQVPEGN